MLPFFLLLALIVQPSARWVNVLPGKQVALDSSSVRRIGDDVYRVVIRRELTPSLTSVSTDEVACGRGAVRTILSELNAKATATPSEPFEDIRSGTAAATLYSNICRIVSRKPLVLPTTGTLREPMGASHRDALRGMEATFRVARKSDVNGLPRFQALSADGLQVLELVGPAANISSSSLTCGIPGGQLSRAAECLGHAGQLIANLNPAMRACGP